MDGVLIVNKPAGWTSHDVVAKARGILRTRRIGHAGTLDPSATGVLVLCIGRATRLAQHIADGEKEYMATAVFGAATDTQDAEGEVTSSTDATALTGEALERALELFRGRIRQIPPMVSAVHHSGRRLYELAREGREVEREPREVEIHELKLLDFRPGERAEAKLRVVCSKGTYVRTLCHDLGGNLGVGAHLAELVRTRVGRFRIEDSASLEDVAALAADGRVGEKMIPMADALSHLASFKVSEEQATTVLHGGQIVVPGTAATARSDEVVILSSAGELLALAKPIRAGTLMALQPTRVFVDPPSSEALNTKRSPSSPPEAEGP